MIRVIAEENRKKLIKRSGNFFIKILFDNLLALYA